MTNKEYYEKYKKEYDRFFKRYRFIKFPWLYWPCQVLIAIGEFLLTFILAIGIACLIGLVLSAFKSHNQVKSHPAHKWQAPHYIRWTWRRLR